MLQYLFGCHHQHLSRVYSGCPWRKLSYQVCVDCGAEFSYNLATMRRGPRLLRAPYTPDTVALMREQHQGATLSARLVAFVAELME